MFKRAANLPTRHHMPKLFRRQSPLQRGAVVVFACFMISVCAGCASVSAELPNARFPDDPQKETKFRCSERRGGEQYVPEREFRTDGCTLWPDSDWQACCVEHDMTYWCGGTAEERKAADKAIRECVAETGHPLVGSLMSGVIRVTGLRFFPTPWRWGYGWPWIGDMEREADTEENPRVP